MLAAPCPEACQQPDDESDALGAARGVVLAVCLSLGAWALAALAWQLLH